MSVKSHSQMVMIGLGSAFALLAAACSSSPADHDTATSEPRPTTSLDGAGSEHLSDLPVPTEAKLLRRTDEDEEWELDASTMSFADLKKWYVDRLRPGDIPNDAAVPGWKEWAACESPTTSPPPIPSQYAWGRRGTLDRLSLRLSDTPPQIVISRTTSDFDCYGAP